MERTSELDYGWNCANPGEVWQAADNVLYVRSKTGWIGFGLTEELPADLKTVAEGKMMHRLLFADGTIDLDHPKIDDYALERYKAGSDAEWFANHDD